MTRLPERPSQPLKASLGITLRAFDNSRDVKNLQFKKAAIPIFVNELGNFKDPVNPVHPLKAYCPIFPSLLDSVRVPFNPVQFQKACSPISVTELGMTRSPVRLLLLKNA